MCELCNKVFNESENSCIAPKCRGAENIFPTVVWVLKEDWENFAVQGALALNFLKTFLNSRALFSYFDGEEGNNIKD